MCGQVGSGKTTLFQAILGELPYYSGSIFTKGTVSYCEQDLIIFSWTIKENILFDRPYDEERYQKVVEVSCLRKDF